MGDTKIQWTEKTWSPIRARVKADAGAIAEAKGYTSLAQLATKMAGHAGPHCEHVSPGCENCYSGTNNGRRLPSNPVRLFSLSSSERNHSMDIRFTNRFTTEPPMGTCT